ncbi:type VII secretion system-associated protein [Streptomyces sp. NPDC098781]|uniref:type VII secretion system-associated protein n=1 Tax=Streptomyces sp. NPDC098781 TaxID=3366097 RepID=UPI003814BE4D
MTDKHGEPLKLDKEGLQRFIEDEVRPFITELKEMTEPTLYGPSLAQVIGREEMDRKELWGLAVPLAIGNMAGGDGKFPDVKGRELSDKVIAAAESVIDVIDSHIKLFTEMEEGLLTTVKTLFKEQENSLEKMPGDKIMEVFEDVDYYLTKGDPGSGKPEEK